MAEYAALKSATKAGRSQVPRKERSSTNISLRVSEQTRDLIDSAAAVVGKSRTEFMLESARQQAVGILLDQRLFQLDDENLEAFAQALDNPPPANAELKALMRRTPLWET